MFGKKKKEKAVSDNCSCENKAVAPHNERACGNCSNSSAKAKAVSNNRASTTKGSARSCGARSTKSSASASSAKAEK